MDRLPGIVSSQALRLAWNERISEVTRVYRHELSAQDLHKSQTPPPQVFPTFVVVTTFQVGTRPEVSDQPAFDVGDMLHSLAAFWSHERNVLIQIKTPLGLRAEADEDLVRQYLSTKLANSLPQGSPVDDSASASTAEPDYGRATLDGITPFVLIASEADGQIRIAMLIEDCSTIVLLPKKR